MADFTELVGRCFPSAWVTPGAMRVNGTCRDGVAIDHDRNQTIDLFGMSHPDDATSVVVTPWPRRAKWAPHGTCTVPPPAATPAQQPSTSQPQAHAQQSQPLPSPPVPIGLPPYADRSTCEIPSL
ncbi:MAG: hypothetical protein HYV02_00460 [Deltaproteobacteria bacterium]|nr:hypothetical protein [Deltaproteobacteria bacterium]